ncbi:MAG: serine/threonine-protein kinase [Planctomycetota bacterium]
MDEEGSNTQAEELAEEFIRIRNEGYEPDLEEFLSRVPDGERDACKEAIHRLLEGGEEPATESPDLLVEVPEPASGEGALGPPPEIPGLAEEPAGESPFEPSPDIPGIEEEPAGPSPAPPQLVEDQLEAEPPAPELLEEPQEAPPEIPAHAEEPFEPGAEEEPERVSETPALALDTTAPDAAREAGSPGSAPESIAIPGFRIDDCLGEGGSGAVYVAWEEARQRRVALKLLRPGRPGLPLDRVLEGARTAATLHDPSIAEIYAVTQLEDRPAIVMELVEGLPLDEAATGLSFRKKGRLLLAVARALALAHEHGIVHRSLKPRNILVTASLQPKLLDLGLAISTRMPADAEEGHIGPPLFVSPEQAAGERATEASDIFSFGSVMFAVLAGEPPFAGAGAGELLERIRSADTPFPLDVAPRVPQDLQAVCLACLARDPADRPAAESVAEDLGRYLAGEPVRLRPALYRDVVRSRIAGHDQDLEQCARLGIVDGAERDRLGAVYRRVLSDETPWVFDPRRISLAQSLLIAGAWAAVVGAALFVWFAPEELPVTERWAIPAACFAALFLAGVNASFRREERASAAFIAGAVLALFPAALAVLVECGIFLLPRQGVEQLLPGTGFTNDRLLAASGASLLLSLICLAAMRRPIFAWTTAALVAVTYFCGLLNRNLLGLETEQAALLLLPLLLLSVPALLFEAGGRVRWSAPFQLVALIALVGGLDLMAAEGRVFRLVGLDAVAASERAEHLAFASVGLVLCALMLVLERAGSMDLRRGARLLQLLVPVHLVPALYFNAAASGRSPDLEAYFATLLLLLLLASGRVRVWLLGGALAGMALGAHLVLDLGLVATDQFTIGLAIGGVVLAFAAYIYLLFRRG